MINIKVNKKLTSEQILCLSKNPITYNDDDSDVVKSEIPTEITIFPNEEINYSSGMPVIDVSKQIEINKLSRYIFPRVDLGPTEQGKIEIPPLHSLEYAVI